MSLIPGTLPSDSCFGTPQEVLELFAQYLDIPAFAVSSKVLYSDTSPLPSTDFIWVDTTGSQNNVLKIYNTIASTYQEYPLAGTAGSPNTLIDGKSTIPAPITSSDNILVSQNGVLYKAPANSFGKVFQVVQGSTITPTTVSTGTRTDSGLTVTITPSSNTSKVLVLVSQAIRYNRDSAVADQGAYLYLMRGPTDIYTASSGGFDVFFQSSATMAVYIGAPWAFHILDAPATASAVTYKVQGNPKTTSNNGNIVFQQAGAQSTIIAMEIKA